MFSRNSNYKQRPAWARYAVAAASVVVGWAAREAISGAVGPTALPFIFFFPAVAMAAWYGGLGPGVLATLLSAATANWFFIEPVNAWAVGNLGDNAAMAAFVLSCLFIVGAIQAMHRARANEARQKSLTALTLASIGDAVIATDEKGNVNFLNAEAERLTGWKSAEAAGRPLTAVFPIINENTREPAENPVEKVLRTGMVVGLANHTVLVSKDGKETPIDDSAAPIRDGEQPVAGVVLVFRDVTEQRRAHEAKARLAAVVEHSGDVILTKNLDGVIQTWNASAEKLFGYSAEEIIGKPATTLFPPERLQEEDYILGSLRQGRPVERFETIRVAKNGRRIPVAVSLSPLRNAEDEIVGVSKIVQDFTELAAARESLVREKELLATTLASIGDAVIVTDADGRLTFLNAEAEMLTGWKSLDAVGHPLPEVFRIINEQTRQPVENPVEKVFRLGGVVGLANHTILIARDGREIPIDDSAAPIRQPGGPLYGVVLVFRDFTERKRNEEALSEAHAQLANRAVQLEERVQERTAKLQEVVNDLQHVSYSIAHDMRAPLRAMHTFASLLSEEAQTASAPAQTQDYIRRIIVAASRLDRLIQDTLHYTKLVQQEMPLGPVDLSKLVRELVEVYPNLHADKADISIEGELPVVLGNDSLLTQCFSNLLGNAVKFVAPGVRPGVRVRAEERDSTAKIWIEDNGIGIEKNAQARLFKMFQKLDGQYEGTGVGLAIVRKVAERMGGKVGVESEPGAGSRFWVDLPLANGNDKGKMEHR